MKCFALFHFALFIRIYSLCDKLISHILPTLSSSKTHCAKESLSGHLLFRRWKEAIVSDSKSDVLKKKSNNYIPHKRNHKHYFFSYFLFMIDSLLIILLIPQGRKKESSWTDLNLKFKNLIPIKFSLC